jgi:hypothetical protein
MAEELSGSGDMLRNGAGITSRVPECVKVIRRRRQWYRVHLRYINRKLDYVSLKIKELVAAAGDPFCNNRTILNLFAVGR